VTRIYVAQWVAMTADRRSSAAPRTGKLSKREKALHVAHAANGYGSRHDFDKGFRKGWNAAIEAEAGAAPAEPALDVERLGAAMEAACDALSVWSLSPADALVLHARLHSKPDPEPAP
jgi:hypothetical protein